LNLSLKTCKNKIIKHPNRRLNFSSLGITAILIASAAEQLKTFLVRWPKQALMPFESTADLSDAI